MSLNLATLPQKGLAIRQKASISGPTNLDPTFLKSFTQLIRADDQRILQVKRFPYVSQAWVYACCTAITREIKGLEVLFRKAFQKGPGVTDRPE